MKAWEQAAACLRTNNVKLTLGEWILQRLQKGRKGAASAARLVLAMFSAYSAFLSTDCTASG